MARSNLGVFALVGAGAVVGAVGAGVVMNAGREVKAAPALTPVSLPSVEQPKTPGDAELAARRRRGAYLWAVGGCNDCHTPRDDKGQPIPSMMMAGHPEKAPLPKWDPSMLKDNVLATMDPTVTAFAGPWGVSVASNLTPDKETGIGDMTAEQLMKSWRSGNHWKEPRPVLPPMPAAAFGAMTDEDIRSIHAFLMSMPPVRNAVPKSVVAPPPPAAAEPAKPAR